MIFAMMPVLNRYSFFILLLLSLASCKYDKYYEMHPPEPEIRLKWNKAYNLETKEKIETGLLWCFHFLGASVPEGSMKKALQWEGPEILHLYPGQLGFSAESLKHISILTEQLKGSEEYRKTSHIDVGRFIMLCLNASKHYYKITGMPSTLEEFKKDRHFDSTRVAFLQSGISPGHRMVEFGRYDPFSVRGTAFVAMEGHGKIDSGTFKADEFEVLDMMDNGHFRYGIYDRNGKLIDAVDPVLSVAGKPAKCLWCHESTLQPSFVNPPAVNGYYSPDSFKAILGIILKHVDNYRNTLKSDLDFSKKQDHTELELLYISFSEPSAARLALEWQMSEAEVKQRLNGLNTHTHAEFPFLGTLYKRAEVDALAPWTVIRVSESAREKSSYEPQLIP